MKNGMLLGLGLLLILSGCGAPSTPSTPNPAKTPAAPPAAPDKPLEIAFIPMGLSHQFWVTMKLGADAAAKELGVKVLWQGPAKETEIDKQINIVQDMIVRKVDGIVLAACDANALAGVVTQADQAGIPVVNVDSGVACDAPKSLVATDNVKGAAEAARVLGELIGGAGDVGFIPFSQGTGTNTLREQGFHEGLAKLPNVKLVSTQYSQSDVGVAMNVATDMLTGNPGIKGIFAANEAGAVGTAQALRATGKAGQVKLVGFDASGEEINALREGVIQAIVVQNPFKMGYEGVKAVVAVKKGQTVEKRIDTGVTVVTKDNLDTPEIQALLNPKG